MNSTPLASFTIQTTFTENFKQKVKGFRRKLAAAFSIFSVLMIATVIEQNYLHISFIEAFFITLFCFGFPTWIVWTFITRAILKENDTEDLYLPFTLNFYEDKIIFHEFYQARHTLSKLDEWKIEHFAKELIKPERNIEYSHTHLQGFELTHDKNHFIVILNVANSLQRFNIETSPRNDMVSMSRVLRQLYEKKIKVKEQNSQNQTTYLFKVVENKDNEKIDPNIQKLIDELGTHKQEE